MARKYETTDVSFSTIKPAHKSIPLKPIDATFLDRLLVNSYIPTFFAYHLANDSLDEYSKFVTRIKESLQQVLVPFSPFAGRWITDDKNVHQLIDNGEGIPITETYIDEDIDAVVQASDRIEVVPELNAISFEAAGFDVSKPQQEMRPEGVPPLLVQFMSAWSEVARTGKLTFQPDFNRVAATTFEPTIKETFGETIPCDGALGRIYRLEFRIVAGDPAVTRTYEVKASAIEALKKEAKESPSGKFVSTNDCITAKLSKILALLSSSLTKGKQTLVVFILEGRERFYDTPLPNVVGNVLHTTAAPMPSNSEVAKKSVYSLAQIVRESLLKLDAKTLFSAESLQGFLNLSDTNILPWINSSWSGYPVYDIDFGVGGKPYYFVPCNIGFSRQVLGTSYVLPPMPGRSCSAATVHFHSTPEVLEAMESLDEFWSFFVKIPRLITQFQH